MGTTWRNVTEQPQIRIILLGAVLLGIAVGAGLILSSPTLPFATASTPEILEGDFTAATSSGLFAFTGQTCSSDSDCPQTQCVGDSYYVDTDGTRECTYNEDTGENDCGGYDKIYGDAKYCGGRYDYSCDSTGCDGYKEACRDDCSANTGCDTYDFCSTDDDGSSGSSDGTTKTDACTEFTKKCSNGALVECQDTDNDGYTDGFVTLQACSVGCENAQCVVPTTIVYVPTSDMEQCKAIEVEETAVPADAYHDEQQCHEQLPEDEPSWGEKVDAAVFSIVNDITAFVAGLFGG